MVVLIENGKLFDCHKLKLNEVNNIGRDRYLTETPELMKNKSRP